MEQYAGGCNDIAADIAAEKRRLDKTDDERRGLHVVEDDTRTRQDPNPLRPRVRTNPERS